MSFRPVQNLVWKVQAFKKNWIDASYSDKELNYESDSQAQQPVHMSITTQMAVCMTTVQKAPSNCQLVTKLSHAREIADN